MSLFHSSHAASSGRTSTTGVRPHEVLADWIGECAVSPVNGPGWGAYSPDHSAQGDPLPGDKASGRLELMQRSG